MKRLNHVQRTALITVLCAAVFVSGALAAGPPTVTVAVTGSAVPGATVSAKATVKINDGSVLQSITWVQSGGPAITFTGGTTDTITTTLPDRKTFRARLIEVLEEPPVAAKDLPANVPLPATWENGLQDRFGVVGISNHALGEAGAISFDLTIVTSSGTYHVPATIAASLPWETSTGQRNVPIKLPVIVHGKNQATYNWALTAPTGSTATLADPTLQNPEFTPDVPGTYKLTVTELSKNSTVTLNVFAGKWKGVITGQDANGRPTVDANCKTCHVGLLELFTPWSKSGHAEILTQNVNDPSSTNHYSVACLECHSVGYSPTALNNGGVTDAADWAKAAALIPPPGDPLKWTKILSDAPASARLMNIQCENCHGPQDSDGHGQTSARVNLSSDVCGSCHGEPARHGRFQQWQLSGHANYETAVAEGTNASCTKCHSAQGFLQWADNKFSTTPIKVTWTADEVHPQTCVVCHDPHAEGNTSGGPTTDATVRVTDTTPMLDAGFSATNVGRAAICMTCHNGRRGLRDEQHFSTTDLSRAPHVGPQTDVLMGQNMYFAKVGTRSFHSMVPDSCVTCHMESTPPPATLSSNFGGTNHTFYASNTICSKCHSSITAASIQGPVMTKMANLKSGIEAALKGTMQAQIRAGNSIALGTTKTVKYANDITGVEFIESHGAQGVTVTLAGGTKVADLSLATVKVVRPSGSSVELLAVADPAIAKAGWNYFMVNSDKSKGVHNPLFVNSALDIAVFATTAYNSVVAAPAVGGGNASMGGGLGNGAGAVSCTTPYVYWAEIAGHMPGAAGSQWRTDLIARNLGSADASVKFVLHQADGTSLQGSGTVVASGQKAFEDVVALMNGGNNIGALEICSDQPLLVAGRIFTQASSGTFGQNLDGKVADLGYSAGQTINLIGLRQRVDLYRSNISVTNGGTTEAQVSVSLFDATGLPVKTYTLTVPAGTVLQDGEPYKNRANTPDIDWGFATVTVLKGTNVLTSASMIDSRTNDPTTIPAKQ